jgi:hypothetical protein
MANRFPSRHHAQHIVNELSEQLEIERANLKAKTMGTFRSVYTRLSCARCQTRFRAEVQFKTGADWQEQYEGGAKLPPSDDLQPGQSFDGCADRFCPACFRLFRAAEVTAHYEALADCVERGRLSIAHAGAARPLTPAQLRDAGAGKADDIRGGTADPGAWQGLAKYKLIWDGQDAKPANGPYLAFMESLDRRIGKKLKSAGWDAGRRWLRENLVVRVKEDATIYVPGDEE